MLGEDESKSVTKGLSKRSLAGLETRCTTGDAEATTILMTHASHREWLLYYIYIKIFICHYVEIRNIQDDSKTTVQQEVTRPAALQLAIFFFLIIITIKIIIIVMFEIYCGTLFYQEYFKRFYTYVIIFLTYKTPTVVVSFTWSSVHRRRRPD